MPESVFMYRLCPKCFEAYSIDMEICPQDHARLVTPIDRDLTGKVLDDRYSIDCILGEGGMSVVYQAHDDLLNRLVAIKVMRWHSIEPGEGVRRFLNEVRAATSLRSKHTVAIYDAAISQEGFLYYTMELLHGETLAKRIEDRGCLSPNEAIKIALEVCESLEEAHNKGILHRDLKPDNIFLARVDNEEIVKVLDFGIAKQVGRDWDVRRVTKSGVIIGTPQYMSPEQVLGKILDVRSDIYSLGTILFECISGKLPFEKENEQMLMISKVQEDPLALSSVSPDKQIPRELDKLLQRVLSKERDLRPPTVADFRRELQRILVKTSSTGISQEWIEEESSGYEKERRGHKRKSRWIFAFIFSLFLGVIAGTVVSLWTTSEKTKIYKENRFDLSYFEANDEASAPLFHFSLELLDPDLILYKQPRRDLVKIRASKPKGQSDDLLRIIKGAED